jgi:tight adherence protein B
VAWLLRWRHLRALSLQRLTEPFVKVQEREEPEPLAPALPRYHWIPWTAGILVGLTVWLAFGLMPVFCVALGLIVLVLSHLVEANLAEGRALKLEAQLADSIDMIVGALGAGAGMMDAIDGAARESPEPLSSELTNLVGRIRYGDPIQVVLEELGERVPLETFRLFCFTLAVHDETGGSLTATLSTVGRTIRDRIELRRRVRAQATEAQASVVGILFITYGIGFVTWRTYPERMEGFLESSTGLLLASAAMCLQAVGLLWMFRLSRIKY